MMHAAIRGVVASACLSLTATGCAWLPSPRTATFDVEFPEFGALVRSGERLSELRVTVHCAGARGLRDMPDGWSVKIEPLRDHYIVTMRPRVALAHFDGTMPALQIGMRGARSACYGVKLVATLYEGAIVRTRSFRSRTPSGPLIY